MTRTRTTTKTFFALLFGLLLLGGTYGTALSQNADSPKEAPAKQGEMTAMLEHCPMMQDEAKRAEMMENCPMMKEGMMGNEGEMDHAAMMSMMQNCPMMKKMMGEMMENCPMMNGQMQGEGMQGGMMQGMGAAPEASGGQAAATLAADSVQVAEVAIGPNGYQPKQIVLEAGVPARLVFTRTTDGTCAKQIQIPAFGIEKTDLPLNEPVTFEVTPEETGTFTFACGMDMMKGTIVVKS